MQIPPQHPSPEQFSLSLTESFEKQKSTTLPLLQSDADIEHPYQSNFVLPMETRNESSHSATRHLPVLRTQQRTQLHYNEANPPRKMARTKSPSQKIPRSNHNQHENENQTVPSEQQLFETDENGNPKICFSYRTMEKQYEKDTLRMLERIQKSRSFELQQQQQQPKNNQYISQRSTSLKEFATTSHETSEDYHLHYDTGFYIGDDSYENDYNDHYHQDQLQDNQDQFEEEQEIFELDLWRPHFLSTFL